MREINQGLKSSGIAAVCLLALLSCTTIPQLKLNYRIPSGSETLKGKKVFLIVEDSREYKDFLTPGAYEALKDYSGSIAFSVTRQNEAEISLGLYAPLLVVKEGFKRRLQNEGLDIELYEPRNLPKLTVVIKKYSLDLVDRRWVVEMSCEAILEQGDKASASQSISGRGERLRIIGTKEADEILGEVFTDLLNRVDVAGLFRRAKLL